MFIHKWNEKETWIRAALDEKCSCLFATASFPRKRETRNTGEVPDWIPACAGMKKTAACAGMKKTLPFQIMRIHQL